MNGSRVLYLPVLGLALFWAVLVGSCNRSSVQKGFIVVLALSQFLMLDHNLRIWRRVADLSQQTCKALGGTLHSDACSALVRDLPAQWQGVYFLRNGFPQCVALNSGIEAGRIHVDDRRPPLPGERVFVWNNGAARLDAAGR